MTALRELIEAVEAGDGHYMCRVSRYAANFPSINDADDARRAFTGDLNAARALHEAVLPDYQCYFRRNDDGLWDVGVGLDDDSPWHEVFGTDNPARGLMLCDLQAMEAQG